MPPKPKPQDSESAGPRAVLRVAAGLLAGAVTFTAITVAAGPLDPELITHDEAMPYPKVKRGPLDTPFEEVLAAEKPEVVVLGSSVVACAFDAALFEELAGMETTDLTVAGSMSAIWYLLVKNYVAQADPLPKVCILGFRDTYLTVPEYRVEGRYKQVLDRYVDGPEPLLDRLAFLPEIGPFEYLARSHWAPAQRRTEIVRTTETFAKERLAGSLVGRKPEGMRAAVDAVFSAKNKIPSKLTKKQRLAEQLSRSNYFDFAEEAQESFLPEIVRICKESGIQLVLVRMRPRRNAEFPDDRSHFPAAFLNQLPQYSADLDAYLAENDVPILDFAEDLRIPFEWYTSGDHVNLGEARTGFTRLLSESFLAAMEKRQAPK